MKKTIAFIALAVSAMLFIPSAPAGTKPAASITVKIDNFTFTPEILTVQPGTKVTWVNKDDVPHTVTSTEKKFKSRALDTDEQFSFTFSDPGTYKYFCSVHPHMTAKVVVK